MNTLQNKGASIANVMLRKLIVGLALAGGLALGATSFVDSAGAQTGGFCSKFDSGIDGWGPCPSGPNITVTTTTDSGGITPTDTYLKLTDLSGASSACTTDSKYLGDWNAKLGGCGQFCFDFKVFDSGSPPSAITPSFTIFGGGGHATFVANFQVPIGDTTWHQKICAPIAPGASPPTSPNGHWVVTGTWNSIIAAVSMVALPVDFSSSPSEIVGYDNLCMSPGGCGVTPPPEINGCLKDSKVSVKCNPDGTYTVTLSGGSFTGTDITMTSQTAGVTVTPPQQPWAPTTTWTVTGATAGQTVVLAANATSAGHGQAPGTDECCSGEIKIVMPECPKPVGEVIVEKKVKNDTHASASVINSLAFPIHLTCTAPSNLSTTFNLNNGGTHTETNLPFNSVCSVTETTLPPVPANVCPQGSTAVWSTPVITPASATVNPTVTTFTVLNELHCEKASEVIVEKKVKNNTNASATVINSLVFPVGLTCTAPSNLSTTFNLNNGGTHTENNVPYTSVCTVAESTSTLPPPPKDVCPAGTIAGWATPVITPTSATINAPVTVFTVVNELDCNKVGEVGEVIVEKKIKNNTNASASVINSLVFPIGLTCTAPSNLNTTFNLNNGGAHADNNVPYSSVCTVTESTSTLPAVPKDVCPPGSNAVWATPVITPTNATVNATATTFMVVNELDCKKVGDVGSLTVVKKVIYSGPIALPSLIYPVTVTCGSSVTHLNLVNGVAQTVPNIPLNTSCLVVEGPMPPPPNVCPPPSVPVWSTVYVPPSPVSVTGTNTNVEIDNTLKCGPQAGTTDLAIAKTGGTSPVQVPDYSFQLTVTNVGSPFNGTNVIQITDVVPMGMTFLTAGGPNWTCVTLPVAGGGTMTCTYTGPGPTASNQSLGTIGVNAKATGSAPFPPFTNCATVQPKAGSGVTDSNPANDMACVTVTKPHVGCAPPMIPGAVAGQCICPAPKVPGPAPGQCMCPPGMHGDGDACEGPPPHCPPPKVPGPAPGQCVCPPGMHPIGNTCEGPPPPPPPPPPPHCASPMVPGPAPGQCVCPDGTVQRGGTCVRPPVCRPPMVQGAAPGQCVCPDGTVQRGGTCVRPPVCRPPMVQGAAPGQCVCPDGTIQRGGTCVRPPVCRPPMVPGPVPGQCVCPQGTVQRGGACIQRPVCNPPARLNNSGQCECPRDMVAVGNSCIERPRPPPVIPPRDVPHGGPRDNPVEPGGGPRNIPGGPRGGPAENPAGPPHGGAPGQPELPGRR